MKEEINILYIIEKIFYVIAFFFSSDFRQISAKSFGNKPCKIIQLLNASVVSVHSIYYIYASYLWINLIYKQPACDLSLYQIQHWMQERMSSEVR